MTVVPPVAVVTPFVADVVNATLPAAAGEAEAGIVSVNAPVAGSELVVASTVVAAVFLAIDTIHEPVSARPNWSVTDPATVTVSANLPINVAGTVTVADDRACVTE